MVRIVHERIGIGLSSRPGFRGGSRGYVRFDIGTGAARLKPRHAAEQGRQNA